MTSKEVFIAHPKTADQIITLKAFLQALNIEFVVSKEEKDYDPDFVTKIEESREQYQNGEFISVEKKDIKSFLGLE
jgi:hypothetical protein